MILNVGPDAKGRIPKESLERLAQIGPLDEGQRREHLRLHPVRASQAGYGQDHQKWEGICTSIFLKTP